MLTIRMQRTGRKGHAMFRVVVQDSRRTPTSGKVVALLGSYDPHSKSATLKKDKAKFYLEHGAQPSERAAKLLSAEGVDLPKWVKLEDKKTRAIRNVEKLRRNRPEGAEEPVKEAPEAVEESAEVSADAAEENEATETNEEKNEVVAEESKTPETSEEAPEAEPSTEEKKPEETAEADVPEETEAESPEVEKSSDDSTDSKE